MYDNKFNNLILEILEDKFINNKISLDLITFMQDTLTDEKYKPLWDCLLQRCFTDNSC